MRQRPGNRVRHRDRVCCRDTPISRKQNYSPTVTVANLQSLALLAAGHSRRYISSTALSRSLPLPRPLYRANLRLGATDVEVLPSPGCSKPEMHDMYSSARSVQPKRDVRFASASASASAHAPAENPEPSPSRDEKGFGPEHTTGASGICTWSCDSQRGHACLARGRRHGRVSCMLGMARMGHFGLVGRIVACQLSIGFHAMAMGSWFEAMSQIWLGGLGTRIPRHVAGAYLIDGNTRVATRESKAQTAARSRCQRAPSLRRK